MSTGTILALLLAFNSLHTPKKDLREFAHAIAHKVPAAMQLEALAVALVESTFRPLRKPNSSKCVCWLQQMCGKYEKPVCEIMARTLECVKGYLKDIKYWKDNCGSSYLATYRYGFGCCRDGPWFDKHRDDPGVRWVAESKCDNYVARVRAAQSKFEAWLAKRGEG